ncbi:MAG: aminotransferase class V-fold PLP-dependent enzyme [Athalassotoga sp.]|uniref:aminotransferase class V-fold PLP-dependent enzyme n=1 Tax=Athalassotoga sp. TaxID=2022597 RepID=UPI003CFE619D
MQYPLGSEVKKDFPILSTILPNGKRLVYLDNAATTQKPIQVINAVADFYKFTNANVARSAHYLGEKTTIAYNDARKEVAKFINADYDEIIFTSGTTESINTIAYGWGDENLSEGDEIVVMTSEHHSDFVPWQQLALRKKAHFKVVPLREDGTIDIDTIKQYVSPKTKIVACAGMTNSFGVINPIQEIGHIAHKLGAVFVVDGAQSVPSMPTDVKQIDADFLSFSGHKMLAPMGIGVLYVKRSIIESLKPFLTGGGMIDEVKNDSTTFACAPDRYEAGTPNVEGAIGLATAIKYLKKIGMGRILEHERDLLAYAYEKLSSVDRVILYGPKDIEKRGGILSFNIKGIHPHDVASILDANGVAIRSGHHCAQPILRSLNVEFMATARASFYVYNEKSDIDVLVDAIEDAKRRFL